MGNTLVAIAFAAAMASAPQPIQVQFVRGVTGQNVTISIDGKGTKTTFAGKLGFRDVNRTWQSVCADVRSPIAGGDTYLVRPMSTTKMGGRIQMAGNIVAKFFNFARTPDQCAALQIAVWEAIEDGGDHADFRNGRLRVRTTQQVLDLAHDFYEAVREANEAAFLQSEQGGGQGQISTT